MRWLLLPLLLLSGCLATEPDGGNLGNTSTTTDPSAFNCQQQLCLANADDPGSDYALEKFGLHRITNDDDESSWLSLREGLFAFSLARSSPSFDGHAVFAYGLRSAQFKEVAAGPSNHSYLPVTDGAHVVYSLRNTTAAGPRLWNWETSHGERILPLLNQDVKAEGLDFPWVTLNHGFSSNKSLDGYWAYNLEDQRRIFLYHPIRQPGGSYESIIGAEALNGTAVYVLTRAPASNDQAKPQDRIFNSTVYEVNLDSGAQSEVFLDGFGPSRFSVSERYIGIESDLTIWSLDRQTRELRRHSQGQEECGFISGGKEWLAFECSEFGKGYDSSSVILANARTGERIKLFGEGMYFSQIVTDGEFAVIKAMPGTEETVIEIFQQSPAHYDLYWATIDELRAKNGSIFPNE